MSTAAQSVSPSASAGGSSGSPGAGTGDNGQQKPNDNKEPVRTKRKKARRACFSCQRAHLTCGDERPCLRCCQRGIQDNCQDGVRKKAKYLNDEDTPSPMNNPPSHHASAMRQVIPQQSTGQQPTHYDMDQSIPATIEDKHPMHINPQHRPDLYGDEPATGGWFAPLALDMGIAFNSNYARGEFASLNHITAGLPGSAGGTGGVRTPDNLSVSGFSPSQQNFMALGSNDSMLDWTGQSRSNSAGAGMGGNPHGFTIVTGPGSIATPSPEAGSPQAHSQPASIYNPMSGSPRNANGASFYRPHQQASQQQLDQEGRQKGLQQYAHVQHHPQNIHNQAPHFQQQGHNRRRNPAADPSQVYHTVTEPYSYVQAYHRLFAMVETRFTKKDQLRIARAFSAFRPSFIASIQKLTRDDLVFQEKCCQRAIHIFESSLPNIGTPTLVCRRSGEVVVVGKEFCMLSGWPKEVLLGEKPNLNANIPHAKEDEEAAKRVQRMRQRLNAQLNGRGPDAAKDGEDDTSAQEVSSRPKPPGPNPVFLLELLDDESVCEFYEKFSQAAFADSTAKITSKCRILKYKPLAPAPPPPPPNEGEDADMEDDAKEVRQRTSGNDNKINGKRPNDILGSSTTIECMVCWTLRRDTFDIPMLIVMNFLPNLLATSTSHPTATSSSNTREVENANKHQRGGGTGGGHPGGMPGNNNSPLMKMGGELVPVR